MAYYLYWSLFIFALLQVFNKVSSYASLQLGASSDSAVSTGVSVSIKPFLFFLYFFWSVVCILLLNFLLLLKRKKRIIKKKINGSIYLLFIQNTNTSVNNKIPGLLLLGKLSGFASEGCSPKQYWPHRTKRWLGQDQFLMPEEPYKREYL